MPQMAELEGITGKVAEIIDRYSLIINRGEEAGVNVGMVFLVMGLGGDVIDPETGVSLGPKPIEKLRVKVREVYPKFSVAETYRIVTPPDITSFVREHSRWPTAMEVFGPQGPERERFANSRRPTNRRRQARSLASRSTIPCGNWCTKGLLINNTLIFRVGLTSPVRGCSSIHRGTRGGGGWCVRRRASARR